MEEERHEEELKADPYLLPHKPYTWLMIRDSDGVNVNEQHMFYNIAENRYYVRFVPELKNKEVACCYGGWLVLLDCSTQDCSILNILTMEKFQLPLPPQKADVRTHCVMSSSKMDRSCRVILFESDFHQSRVHKFSSCYIGDNEVIEGNFTHQGGSIRDLINFKGKLYALTTPYFNLFESDFSDPGLRLRHVISGQSVTADFTFTHFEENIHLVESCEDLLLIFMSQYGDEISDVRIFKADFKIGEWVKVETLGDRAIFLGSVNNSFSSPASTFGMKGNVVYWIRLFRYLCMYDIEDKSISMSLPYPFMEACPALSWASFPMTCNEEKKLERKDMCFLFEAFPTETTFHVQQVKATIESTELQIVQREPKMREETKTIGKTKIFWNDMVLPSWIGLCLWGVREPQKREETKKIGKTTIFRKESLWEDLPNDLLLEIFKYLFGGDRVVFRSVCRSWYSISPSSRSSQKFVLPVKHLDRSSPFLMCPDNKICHPIFGHLYSMDFLDISGSKVRAARDGWLLMDNSSNELFFLNPITKEEIELPDCDAWFYYSVFFSAPPTSANCLIVVVAELDFGRTSAICYMEIEDEDWTYYEISQGRSFYFSICNPVVFKDQYYFLGSGAKLLIFCPKKTEVSVIEAPKFICDFTIERGQQYMLESDGKLIAVFVSVDGSSVCTCEWNASRSEWEMIVSLENIMLFLSRPLSLCKRATVRGTGNKIYFPRVVGEGHILFYSLATKRYHTFEMGTSYSNFFDSKFYPQHNGWFMP